MLESIRRGQRWLTAFFVVGIGLVFAVFIGTGAPLRPSEAGAVITLGDHRVTLDEFYRMRERQEQLYRDALGDNFDARQMRSTIDANAASVLVERTVLAAEAENLGLTVAKQEVERSLLQNPNFRGEDGRFDRETFGLWVQRNFGNERTFRAEQRRGALASKLIRAINLQAQVSEDEARLAVEQRMEQVKLAFPVLNAAEAGAAIERDEAEVAAYAAENAAQVQALYDERIEQFDVPEQANARHILISVARDADAELIEKASAAIDESRQRIVDGEDFDAVAQEVSQDPGSAANGGSLGWFRRGQMVSEFDEAAFGLELGTLSEPVRTDFGFHLIRVDERKAAEVRTLEEVTPDLAFELLRDERGAAEARAQAERISAAVRAGSSLEDAVRAEELTLERTNWVRRHPEGFVPGLGPAPDLLATAFTLEAGQSSDRIFEAGGALSLVQVLERERIPTEELDALVAQERETLRRTRLESRIGAWIAVRRNELVESGDLVVDLSFLD